MNRPVPSPFAAIAADQPSSSRAVSNSQAPQAEVTYEYTDEHIMPSIAEDASSNPGKALLNLDKCARDMLRPGKGSLLLNKTCCKDLKSRWPCDLTIAQYNLAAMQAVRRSKSPNQFVQAICHQECVTTGDRSN